MIYDNNRNAFRQSFAEVWRKHLNQERLTSLEQQIAQIIICHPEYQVFLTEENQNINFPPEQNPYLHMSLHLALNDQINTNKPEGIKKIYQFLMTKMQDPHLVQHSMMKCLADILWESQKKQLPPSDENYLRLLYQLLND